ncbi:MAG: 2TM domain-containing protein [Ginsengibacter sp.]
MEQETKDPELWKIAQKRAGFKYHVLIYFIMNIFFWTLWYIGLKDTASSPVAIDTIPWPVWPMLGWGIGVFFNYLAAYKSGNSMAQKEYDKLKNKQNQ